MRLLEQDKMVGVDNDYINNEKEEKENGES